MGVRRGKAEDETRTDSSTGLQLRLLMCMQILQKLYGCESHPLRVAGEPEREKLLLEGSECIG